MQSPNSFHTQSNLSATLYAICIEHHSSVPKPAEASNKLPEFVSESVHIICQNIAKLMNEDFSNTEYWENIEQHSKLAKEIIENNTKPKTDGE
jgi:hypothetical protein